VRIELGIVGVTLLLIVAGQGVLLALGLTRLRPRTLFASSGLAYLAGVASTLLVGILMLALGISLSLPVFAALSLLLGAAGAALAIRRGERRGYPSEDALARTRMSRPQLAAIGLGCILLVALMVLGLIDAGLRPLAEWDSWSIWTRKALVLTSGGLDTQVFAGAPYGFAHLDYPILLPLFESVYFRGMGVGDTQAIHAVLWLLYAASLGAIAYLGSRITRIWVWLPVVLALALGLQFYSQLLSAYADVPLGLLAAPGVLCVGLWLREREWCWLALGALLLAAVANVKNEGVLLMAAVFVAAAMVLAAGRLWRPLLRLGLGLLGVVVAIAPWRIWVAAHDIKSNLPISKGLDPSYLAERSGRIGPTLKALLPMLESGGLSYVVPLALVLVVLGVATTGIRRVAAFYLLAGVGTLASVVWAFVITEDSLDWQIATAGSRVIMGVAFVSVAALVHVGGLLDASRSAALRADRDGERGAPEAVRSGPADPAAPRAGEAARG
jgi:hypothetical protein